METTKWQRLQYMPCTPLGDTYLTGCAAHRELSRRAASQGMVLLKNTERCLPFARGKKLAVFGKAQFDYVKGGGGSGDVTVAYSRSIAQGLAVKQEEGKLRIFDALYAFYAQEVLPRIALPGNAPEPEVPEDLLLRAREFTDTALITLCRFSGEAADRSTQDFYLTAQEKKLLARVTERFPHCVVCLNIGGIIDTSALRDSEAVRAILLAWQAGMEGGLAVADVLCGDASPDGRLTDTFADSIDTYPSTKSILEADEYVNYTEDIYVGYRYFETIPGASEHVCYPFGYGLSYTDFSVEFVQAEQTGDALTFTIQVKNTGIRAGRQVAQVYCSAPQGLLTKPARQLTGFAKTKALEPGETELLQVRFSLYDLASYDDTGKLQASAYVLESGEYRFFIGENVRDARQIGWSFRLEEARVLQQLSPKCAPVTDSRRLLADGSYEDIPAATPAPPQAESDRSAPPEDGCYPDEQQWHIPYCAWHQPTLPQLREVAQGKLSAEEFLQALNTRQLVHLLGGQPNRGCANTFGIGNLPIYGVPNAMTADGPAGLRIKPECGVNTTAFPCATMLACTWDTALLREIGRAGAAEVRENGMGIWLTPALNIHRSPLCGRNFEYYSEDPLLSGMMASAMVQGIQSMGIAASVKHFACNNKESNRRDSDSRLSERALREIYLRGFEICVKTAQPWTVMCAYNLLNGVRVSENRALLTDILRGEWGYDGLVITDWYTYGMQYAEIAAGADVKMGCGMPEHTMQMIEEGKLSVADVRRSASRVLEMLLRLS